MTFVKGHKLNLGNQYAKGNKHTPEWKRAASERMKGNTQGFVKGKQSPRKGRKATKPAWNKGKKLPNQSGEHHPRWKKDRTKAMEKRNLRMSFEWKEWRARVFLRDLYTCRECGISGVYIEPHHIVPTRDSVEKIFDITNRITLCRPCHKKTVWREDSYAEKYLKLAKTKLSKR